MNSLERTIAFIQNREVDRVPFHPIFMQFTARYAGVNYRDFCLDPEVKVAANIQCAREFGYDWVNVMSDPYAEAEAFGVLVDYPINSLPIPRKLVLQDLTEVDGLRVPSVWEGRRTQARVREIELFRERVGDEFFICGWVEGPLAEYCDLRDLTSAMMDFYLNPEPMERALDVITDFALNFITAQVKAGAHCIGIGDAVCSQISPELYRQFVFEREKRMVAHIHKLGARAKLHICGNTRGILPDMIQTGADIIDLDHLVGDMGQFVPLLAPHQVFSGNSDPVSVLLQGSREAIQESVRACHHQMRGRGIVSAGCEIPVSTSYENIRAYREAAKGL